MDEQLPVISEQFWTDESALGKRLVVPKNKPKIDRDAQAQNIVHAFEMMGGVRRLAAWAHEHPGFFFTKLYTKVLPQASTVEHSGSVNIVYRAAIPPSPLDGDYEDVTPQPSPPAPLALGMSFAGAGSELSNDHIHAADHTG